MWALLIYWKRFILEGLGRQTMGVCWNRAHLKVLEEHSQNERFKYWKPKASDAQQSDWFAEIRITQVMCKLISLKFHFLNSNT